jgi:hypothetical protein
MNLVEYLPTPHAEGRLIALTRLKILATDKFFGSFKTA